MFDLGVAEVLKTSKKPYIRTYQPEIMRIKLNALPPPVLMEDYIQRIAVTAVELFPQLSRYRDVARRTVGSAKLLHSEGRNAEAEAVLDTWRPYAKQLAGTNKTYLIHQLVALMATKILTKEGVAVYNDLGAHDKAMDADATYKQLMAIKDYLEARKRNPGTDTVLRNNSSALSSILVPIFPGVKPPTIEELKPGRMQEHVIAEEVAVQGLIIVLMLALLGTVFQGTVWSFRLRRAGSASILLLPPTKVVAKSILLGAVLPMLIYWVYSRIPIVGGREFGLSSYMSPRFMTEMLVTAFVALWLPSHIIRGYIRRRCSELDIPMPDARRERTISRRVRGAVIAGIVLVAAVFFVPTLTSPIVTTAGVLLAVLLVAAAVGHAGRMRRDYGLYFGTLARSSAPVYAFLIILFSVVVQPLQMQSEAIWLRRDTVMFGQLLDRSSKTAGYTRIENEASEMYQRMILNALKHD